MNEEKKSKDIGKEKRKLLLIDSVTVCLEKLWETVR